MSESAEKSANWASDWIAQQRKKFEQQGAAPGTAEDPTNLFGAFFQNAMQGLQMPGQAAPVRGVGPAIGLMREHEQAWRDLGEAQAQYRHLEGAVLMQLNAVQLEALSLLEQRMRERGSTKPIKEMRELYDLWVECGEEVYARCVRSEPYCNAQAALANAASELRLKQQAILERALRMFDLPTRSEVNSVHRQLREIRERLDALSASGKHDAAASKQSVSRKSTARKAAARRKTP